MPARITAQRAQRRDRLHDRDSALRATIATRRAAFEVLCDKRDGIVVTQSAAVDLWPMASLRLPSQQNGTRIDSRKSSSESRKHAGQVPFGNRRSGISLALQTSVIVRVWPLQCRVL